jgi:hypothetical protein
VAYVYFVRAQFWSTFSRLCNTLLPIASADRNPEDFIAEVGNQWVAPMMLPEDLELQAFAPMETRLEFKISDVVTVGLQQEKKKKTPHPLTSLFLAKLNCFRFLGNKCKQPCCFRTAAVDLASLCTRLG